MTALEKYVPLLFLLMWSSGAIVVTMGLEDASVSVFLTVRSVGGALALFILCVLVGIKGGVGNKLSLPKSLLLRAFVIGLFLQVGYQSAFFLALYYKLTPGVLSILLGMQPILTPLFAREKIGIKGCLFLSLGLVGLMVAIVGAREIGAVTLAGLAFGAISVLAISIGSVMQKKSTVDPVVSAFYQSLSASLIFLLVLPVTDIHLKITPVFILSATWMIVVVSTLAVLLLFYMLSRNSASKVGVLFYLVPIITMALDYVAFGHKVSWVTIAGALLVIAAVKGFHQGNKLSSTESQHNLKAKTL